MSSDLLYQIRSMQLGISRMFLYHIDISQWYWIGNMYSISISQYKTNKYQSFIFDFYKFWNLNSTYTETEVNNCFALCVHSLWKVKELSF